MNQTEQSLIMVPAPAMKWPAKNRFAFFAERTHFHVNYPFGQLRLLDEPSERGEASSRFRGRGRGRNPVRGSGGRHCRDQSEQGNRP